MVGDTEQFPPLIQALVYLGGGVAAAVMWIISGWKRRPDDDEDPERQQLNALIRQLDRQQTTSDIEAMRRDMEQVIGAMREAILTKIDQGSAELYKRVGELERGLIRIEERLRSRKTHET